MVLEELLRGGQVNVWTETFAVIKSKKSYPNAFANIIDKTETTVILEESQVQDMNVFDIEHDWKILTFDMHLPFRLVGFLATVASVLADKEIPIIAISAYSTDTRARYEKELSRLLTGSEDIPSLNQMPHVKVYDLTDLERLDERDPTFSFKIKGLKEDKVVKRLWTQHAIATRAENFYSRVHDVYESPTMIRASFVQYNTPEEVVSLLKALEMMI